MRAAAVAAAAGSGAPLKSVTSIPQAASASADSLAQVSIPREICPRPVLAMATLIANLHLFQMQFIMTAVEGKAERTERVGQGASAFRHD